MNIYYEEVIAKIKNLIEKEEYEKAYFIVQEELSLPYIEKGYEEQFIQFYNELKTMVRKDKVKVYDDEDIDALLNGSLDEVFLAIEQLRNLNIRNHLDAIRTYLKNEPHFLAKAYLIEALMEQNVSEEFEVEHEEMNVTFIPCYIEPVMECDGTLEVIEYLREWFENDNPSMLMMCVETLVKETYLMLPFNIEIEDAKAIAISIALYVFVAMGQNDQIQSFLDKYELESECGYPLLINGYDM